MAAAEELRAAAYKGDCGKMRELLDGGGASAVNERTEVMDSRRGEMFVATTQSLLSPPPSALAVAGAARSSTGVCRMAPRSRRRDRAPTRNLQVWEVYK
jgi:hypothetical protein